MRKLFALLLCMIMVCGFFVGCTATPADKSAESSQPAAPSTAASSPADTSPAGNSEGTSQKKFKIGYDIYWLGNTWSVLFAEEFKAAAASDKYKDLIEVVYTESENDTNKMINNIQDLITQECDAIIITPTSTTALNPVLKEARDAGIIVVLNATVSDDPNAYDALVYYDNYQTSLARAEWLCKELNYEGNILEIAGISGYAANEDSLKGHKEIVDKYPNVNIIATIDGQWDYAATKTEMASALLAYPDIDGILCQNGQSALGAIEAMEEAGREVVPITGEDNNGFMKKWKWIMEQQKAGVAQYAKFDAVAHAMPVYISVTALDVALKLLNGETLEFEPNYTYEKAILEQGVGLIDSTTLDQYVKPDLPDGVNTLTTLSDEYLKKLFDN